VSGKTLVIPNTIGGARLAQPHNENFAAVADVLNGNIGDVNLAANAVSTPALQDAAVTGAKVANETLMPEKLHGSARTTHNARLAMTADKSLTNKKHDVFTLLAHSRSYDHTLLIAGALYVAASGDTTQTAKLYVRNSAVAYADAPASGTPDGTILYLSTETSNSREEVMPFYYCLSCAANTEYNLRFTASNSGTVAVVFYGGAADTNRRGYAEIIELPA